MWNVLRDKFYAPIRKIDVKGGVREVDKKAGRVSVVSVLYARQLGTVPQRGVVRWTIRDASGRLLEWGQSKKRTLYPKRLSKQVLRVDIGTAARLRPAPTRCASASSRRRRPTTPPRWSSANRTRRRRDEIVTRIGRKPRNNPRASGVSRPCIRSIRPIAFAAMRSALLVGLAVMLILVMLPAALEIQAPS